MIGYFCLFIRLLFVLEGKLIVMQYNTESGSSSFFGRRIEGFFLLLLLLSLLHRVHLGQQFYLFEVGHSHKLFGSGPQLGVGLKHPLENFYKIGSVVLLG